jgi:hypothetical protein
MSGYVIESRNPIQAGSLLLLFVYIPLAILLPPLILPLLLYLSFAFLLMAVRPARVSEAIHPTIRFWAPHSLRAPPLV